MNTERETMANDKGTAEHAENVAFERQLAAALDRVDPPAGFADRAVARAAGLRPALGTSSGAKILPFRRWQWMGGALAATVLLGSFAVQDLRAHRERERQRVLATQQFSTATRITEQAMEHTREQLKRSGVLQDE